MEILAYIIILTVVVFGLWITTTGQRKLDELEKEMMDYEAFEKQRKLDELEKENWKSDFNM